jgi:glycosyltransferase involved in cell wall biosynthesis
MKYSIITVNYNNKEGLRRTIESVIHQTFRDFEYIIIDGGSSDGSTDVLLEYDKQIDYWISEPDNGIYQGMNKGIKQAKGDYLNFMNSGDCFYANDILQKVAHYGNDADIITGRDYHYSEEKQQGHASVQPSYLSMITFFNATLDHQSSFIKRELFNNSLYREDLRLVSDWVFFLEKVVIEGKQVQFIPDIVCYRELAGLTAQQYNKNLQEKDEYLHGLLPIGVYKDYACLTQIDKETLYKLMNLLHHQRAKKILTYCIKIIYRIISKV